MTTPATALPKPIIEALALRISQERLELPVLPAISQQVLQLSFEEQCDGKQLSELIHKDQSLASHLLRIANSPAYAPTDPIVSLQQAVTRLGIGKIREIVLLVITNSHELSIPGWDKWIEDMFTLGLATGLFAKRIAKERRWNAEEAFLCGLLHGVGRPILLDALYNLEQILDCDVFQSVPRDVIVKTIDSLHPRVGGMVLSSWKLPVRIADTVALQRNYAAAKEVGQTVAMTALATDLAASVLDLPALYADLKQHPMLWPLNCYEDELETHLDAGADILAMAHQMAGAM